MTTHDRPRVAVVLTGAAARGAFQAGALAELLPVLDRAGMSPRIVLGTSAGAINAALYGSMAHLDPELTGERLRSLWSSMGDDNVFRSVLCHSPGVAARFAGGFTRLGGGITSLLDTAPLLDTARRELDVDALRSNVAGDLVTAVGVVATRVPPANSSSLGSSSGRAVLFLDDDGRFARRDIAGSFTVAHGPIGPEHVVASAAIPIAFPPVHVTQPTSAAGWYIDGGVRLNAPLNPAIKLDATHIVVISATSVGASAELAPDPSGDPPFAADTGAQTLSAVLSDRMNEDLRALERMNRVVRQGVERGAAPSRSDGETYRRIPFVTIAPPPGRMGALADDVHRRRTRGLGFVWENDNWLIGRLLDGAGDGPGRRELLSYLFFDEEYFDESFDVGRRAARAALAGGWRTERQARPLPITAPLIEQLRIIVG